MCQNSFCCFTLCFHVTFALTSMCTAGIRPFACQHACSHIHCDAPTQKPSTYPLSQSQSNQCIMAHAHPGVAKPSGLHPHQHCSMHTCDMPCSGLAVHSQIAFYHCLHTFETVVPACPVSKVGPWSKAVIGLQHAWRCCQKRHDCSQLLPEHQRLVHESRVTSARQGIC